MGWRAPGATSTTWRGAGRRLPHRLPRHHRPRPVAVEPGPGCRVLPGVLCADRAGAGRPARHRRMRWVGTSMGGAIGMVAAATALKGRISHLVLNDIGPELATVAIERIKSYAGSPPAFDTVTELETCLRTIYKPYGWQSDAQWRRMAETSVAALPERPGHPALRPGMVRQFFAPIRTDYDLWDAYDTLELADAGLARRTLPICNRRHRRTDDPARAARAAGGNRRCGHAPCLNVPRQIELVRHFSPPRIDIPGVLRQKPGHFRSKIPRGRITSAIRMNQRPGNTTVPARLPAPPCGQNSLHQP